MVDIPWNLKTSSSEYTLMEERTFLDGKKVVARHFEFTITFRCRNRCESCPQPKMKKDIPLAIVERGLKEYGGRGDRRLGDMELVLTGGEPTLAKDFLDIARLGFAAGFGAVSVLSSSDNFADMEFARAAYDVGIRRVLLSFHSHRPDIYHRFTGARGQFPKAVRGFTNCLSLPFSTVTCNTVINRRNYKDVPAHAAFLAGLRGKACARAPLSLLLSSLEENPCWDDLCVPYGKAEPYVRKAFEKNLLPIRRFMGDWTMPVCIGGLGDVAPALSPLARRDSPTWYAPKGWTSASSPAPSDFRRVKASSCRECPLDPVCAGLSRVYADRFGVKELGRAPRQPKSALRGEEISAW